MQLPAVPASFTNYTFTAVTASGVSKAVLADVVFGDVWLCGGQSNMEYGVNGSNGALKLVYQ